MTLIVKDRDGYKTTIEGVEKIEFQAVDAWSQLFLYLEDLKTMSCDDIVEMKIKGLG